MTETLCYSVAGGVLVVLATARVEQIAWKFLRLIGFLCLAVTVVPIAWTIRGANPDPSFAQRCVAVSGAVVGVGAVTLIFLAASVSQRAGGIRWLCASAGAAGLASACGAMWSALRGTAAAPQGTLPLVMLIVGQVFGALMLGSITIAWLLGHAYLTATAMTIAPLRHFSRMLSWSVAVRIAFMMLSLAVALLLRPQGDASVLAKLGDVWLIAVLRIGVGLVGVAVFAYMVADCVRLRATQSATGILYFGSVMAYVGELAHQPLIRELGWPL